MFAAAKVGVYLAREDRILGDVCLATVFVEWEEEQPRYAHDDAYEGEVRG